MPNLKHLKCTSQDSVAQQNTDEDFEPYDFTINISAPKLETLYLKYWDLDTFDNTPLWELHEGSPNLKKLVYSSHAIEAPYTLRQRAVVEARTQDGEWQFNLRSEEGGHLSLFGGLQNSQSW
ncbi:hypothetical protein I302_108269 [Kwoniella bestiolae CBS 10118]|uniref:Uncharacterized protein n=1 Tax=Kwoniella bestiolae CBS 10118 TaxID=1296100 RepID=A0A1B9FW61_9TREE|nr:hypothetical protein I302_07364 [Kwoniella bestiolae CBS 10118]OCF23014.1 hypothetical protein I302_07364 [Kwoniella bestiolae CBS 10118]